MTFWICLDIFVVSIVLFGLFTDRKKEKDVLLKIVYTVLFIISSFRYNIATDYSEYVNMFYRVSVFDDSLYPEFSFKLLVEVLRGTIFDYQSVFIVYTMICLLFFYKAVHYWSNKNKDIELISVCFFSLAIIGGFWESMNSIRQTAAAFVMLYGSRYVYEKKYFKFLMYSSLAIFLHYSAVIVLLMPFLPKKIKNGGILLGCCFSSIILKNLGIEKFLFYIFNEIGRGTGYIDNVWNGGGGLGILYFLGIFALSSMFINKSNSKAIFCNTFFLYGVMIRLILMDFNVIGRFAQYFFSFCFITFAIALNNLSDKKYTKIISALILITFIPIHIYMLYKETISLERINDIRTSAGNIEYEFNFDVFK